MQQYLLNASLTGALTPGSSRLFLRPLLQRNNDHTTDPGLGPAARAEADFSPNALDNVGALLTSAIMRQFGDYNHRLPDKVAILA